MEFRGALPLAMEARPYRAESITPQTLQKKPQADCLPGLRADGAARGDGDAHQGHEQVADLVRLAQVERVS